MCRLSDVTTKRLAPYERWFKISLCDREAEYGVTGCIFLHIHSIFRELSSLFRWLRLMCMWV